MTCRELMTPNPVCCSRGEMVAAVARTMAVRNVGALPVVSSKQKGRVIGIVTDRDIAVVMAARGLDPRTTRIDEVMTRGVHTCHPEESCDRALETMAKQQVRRLPVTDSRGRIVGIIAQADIARRLGSRAAVANMLVEVSRPATNGAHKKPSPKPAFPLSIHPGAVAGAGLLIGAGAMYFLDPDRGRRRRALMADQMQSAYRHSLKSVERTGRHIGNGTRGLLAEGRRALRSDQPATPQLAARVRSRLGRLVSHPHAIDVDVLDGGRVILRGSALAKEADHLMTGINTVPGVTRVENHLALYESAEGVPSLQGEGRPSQQEEGLGRYLIPVARIALGIMGGVALFGARWLAQTPPAEAHTEPGEIAPSSSARAAGASRL